MKGIDPGQSCELCGDFLGRKKGRFIYLTIFVTMRRNINERPADIMRAAMLAM